MHTHYIKTNLPYFVFSFAAIIITVFILSYNFLMVEFLELEEKQNKKNTHSFIKVVDTQLNTIYNITKDYSMWDDTYLFIEDANQNYIYENFREGTSTLNDLEIDGIIFSTSDSKVLFSTYISENLISHQQELEENIQKYFTDENDIATLWSFKENLLYVVKSEILKSDKTGEVKGYMYSLKLFSKEHINFINTMFESVTIVSEQKKPYDYAITITNSLKAKIAKHSERDKLFNFILFQDHKQNIFSLRTVNKREIVKRGEKNLYIFNLITLVMLLFIFYILFRNQRLIEEHNSLLDIKVQKKTKQLERAFRKLKVKNKELYTLANIDSLTKVRNRGSFFTQSKKLLRKAIQEDKEFSILIIDIDHFKKINDTYGHASGDKVLMEFCVTINNIIEKDVIFGRIGGEEFCLTFFDVSKADVYKIAENIRLTCQSHTIKCDTHNISFTVSMGLHSRENLTDIDKILQKSDELLYIAKKEGRNRLIRSGEYRE